MKCASSSPDLKVHLAKLRAHLEKMTEQVEYLRVTSEPVSYSTHVNIMIVLMTEVYHATVRNSILLDDLVPIFVQEAEHHLIASGQEAIAEAAMAASQSSKDLG